MSEDGDNSLIALDGQEAENFNFAQALSIADALPMGMAFVGTDHRYRFVNRALADFFDMERSAMLGRSMDELLGAEAMKLRAPILAAALAGERQFFVGEYEHPSRGRLTVQSDYLPQVREDGSVNGVVILVNDVTEQRLAERALKESEARFRRIADSAPVMMWVTRIDRSRDFVNDAYAEFLGAGREEARALDWRSRIHPDDVDRVIAESLAGEASGKPFTLEARYLRHDGEYRWLRSTSQPRFGADGEPLGFIGAATDISFAKEAELELTRQVDERTKQLAASEAQFRAVFEAALEVMVLLEPDGTVIAVNNRRESWRHPHPADSIGKKLWDAPTLSAYPHHAKLMKAGIARAAGGEIFTAEVKMERAGTPTSFLDVSVQPVRGDDGAIAYLLFEARDITDLKNAQEQLRQSQKMEALGQLTGGIAHDFNNLLTVVVGGLDMISRGVGDERLKRYADNALAAAERGARLTAQLLAFSRVQRLEVRPVEVEQLIENMRPLLGNVLGSRIRKRFELAAGPVLVMADPTQLELVVLNLAINARDAMPDGGTLTLETSLAQISDDAELEAGDYVALCVGDTGTGMPPEVLARAFEPFFTTKDVGKGTGLGLSMVYGVARQSGGTARIESTPGEGTRVTIYFKLASGGAERSAARGEPGAAGRDEQDIAVLVVDDDPDVRGFVVGTLADLGYRVSEAGEGKAALELFAKSEFDLVVLDYAMPGMTGDEVAAEMLARRPEQTVLFISGYSETEAIRRAAPDAALLAKPFRADTLDAAVRRALRPGKEARG
ncbi:PAS domain S-box protein [Sphingomonas mesophila]|uniref:PAS domain S-box protein n=1 Tax=Sphingomonas mesophila TaxID=2303576 RepID=UPI000E58064F|nr:PAS domain S-box protein [Sphingomonas mesophila]